MYKKLFILLFGLTASPEKTWKQLSEKQEKETQEDFYKSYLYPIFGIIALLAFIGVLGNLKQFEVAIALKTVIRETLTYFLAFYASSFILTKLLTSYFHFSVTQHRSERFTGYASAPIYLVAMVSALFPSLFFLQILMLYTVYIIWQGAVYYLKLNETNWVKFTIFASISIVLMPGILSFILSLLMPGLK